MLSCSIECDDIFGCYSIVSRAKRGHRPNRVGRVKPLGNLSGERTWPQADPGKEGNETAGRAGVEFMVFFKKALISLTGIEKASHNR